jgi:hypothetical protein
MSFRFDASTWRAQSSSGNDLSLVFGILAKIAWRCVDIVPMHDLNDWIQNIKIPLQNLRKQSYYQVDLWYSALINVSNYHSIIKKMSRT